MQLEALSPGMRIFGIVPGEAVEIIAAPPFGPDAVTVTYRTQGGGLDERLCFREDEVRLKPVSGGGRSFDADSRDFKLAAEAQRIQMAGLYDPMAAVATSNVRPLPHQIRAVYGELLPRTPLRYLLADDPGAGKTIMAGLYIKELILRGDVERCLIVAPGGLVEQWQDELFFRFGLGFTLLTTPMIQASIGVGVFEENPLLIARMDQLARNEELQRQWQETPEWDLVIIDEAHRMSAHSYGHEVKKTKRYQLGESLGEAARNLLLLTATPHSGKEENFQLFLRLLDRDRFAGIGRTRVPTEDVMRRLVKEDLLTFEGKPLFPERIAQSVPYVLTDDETKLYEAVTDYVRDGMNRADKLDGKRRSSVGFALTVLQRRLASSPEAIYKSLARRTDRLERTLRDTQFDAEIFAGPSVDARDIDGGVFSADDVEKLEDRVADSATYAESIEELKTEIMEVRGLAAAADRLRTSGADRKWAELNRILQDNVIPPDEGGNPRKLIIFTEHRDTLNYLTERISEFLGDRAAVVGIHGGVQRMARRDITEEFTKNPACQIMIATDAAGEGLNLHAAHLMVNYDLPWNPNRIEQRFGRIHRIGQSNVCRLWNLVAVSTREGEVFSRLLSKIDEQRQAYGGQVFDVLGSTFVERPLRDLLVEAIRYGDDPAVRARMEQVLDESVSDGLVELMEERALAAEHMSRSEVMDARSQVGDARARRLQPHYVQTVFRAAFHRAGGSLVRRKKGLFEVARVPRALRSGTRTVASGYAQVTFDLDLAAGAGGDHPDLLAPGHALMDATIGYATRALDGVLSRGTVLASNSVPEPVVLVGVVEEVVDGTQCSIAKRYRYVYVDEAGVISDAGNAPYLDCVVPDIDEARGWRERATWAPDAESAAKRWIVTNDLPAYLGSIRPGRSAELAKQRSLVKERLDGERGRLLDEVAAAKAKENGGQTPRESSRNLLAKADEIRSRLDSRMSWFERQSSMSAKPPRVVTSALIVPASDSVRAAQPEFVAAGRLARGRFVDAVGLVAERVAEQGRSAVGARAGDIGFDLVVTDAEEATRYLLVKTWSDSERVWFSHNEIQVGKNLGEDFILVLVRMDPADGTIEDARYVTNPFDTVDVGDIESPGKALNWDTYWRRGRKRL